MVRLVQPERLVLENLGSAVLLFDSGLKLRFANGAAEMLFSGSFRQMAGQTVRELLRCPEVDVMDHIRLVLDTEQALSEREITLKTPDGRLVVVDCTLIPVRSPHDQNVLLVEIHQMDRHLRISREERILSQQEVTRDVVRGLAHEIKNPLGGLRGAAQLLESELNDKELKEYTQIIIEEADRLQNLVNRMLGPNRVPMKSVVNIHHALERVRSLVKAEGRNGVVLNCDYDPSIPEIIGDMDQLIQALLNIVRNAARAVMPKGVITLRTRIRRQCTVGNIRHRHVAAIQIIDNGPGIPEEIRDRLFFPLVTEGTGGMGLGLSISQSLINQHGGLIECSSEPGHTVFTILLPVEC